MHNEDESNRYDVPKAEILLEESDNTNYVTHVESFISTTSFGFTPTNMNKFKNSQQCTIYRKSLEGENYLSFFQFCCKL